ncbi:hypothetical protein RRG08_030695 [Elysia crispata]|uniref:Uncharacterized protein n=1 Tax=Elysia crispata TaxID=231223 RepID=A0AAE0Y4H7_9GAST|nr:hypothetical protein RRG08_030695 [Elysia crispata]
MLYPRDMEWKHINSASGHRVDMEWKHINSASGHRVDMEWKLLIVRRATELNPPASSEALSLKPIEAE